MIQYDSELCAVVNEPRVGSGALQNMPCTHLVSWPSVV